MLIPQRAGVNNSMKLSIVICVYNTAEAFLRNCLRSIYTSTLDRSDFEVILVDDGSDTDYSRLIKEYPVRYFKTTNNGPFAARIYGVRQSVGDYFAFLDSDDSVTKNYHLPMLDAALHSNADIVINGWAFETDRTRRTCYHDSTMATPICSEGPDTLVLYSQQQGREHSYYVNWNKIYRRDVILKTINHLEQSGLAALRLTFAEDALFNFFNFKHAEKVINVNSGFYLYRIHGNQISREGDVTRLKRHIDSMGFVLDCMLSNLDDHPHKAQIAANIDQWRALMARSHYQVACTLRCADLFPHIKAVYHVDQLEQPLARDGSVYVKAELLGDNFAQIDDLLAQIYLSDHPVTIHYNRRCRWISRIVTCTKKQNTAASADGETCAVDFYIPNPRSPLKDRIIHNHVIHRLGMCLFKKGSKMRAFLKKHL